MMKLRSALLLLLCLMLGAVALGETVCMYVDLPGDFAPYGGGWGLAEDGSVWVGGGFGSPGQTRGGLLRAGLDGSCADVTPEGDRAEGLYGDVIPLGEDGCIAVRSVNLEDGYAEYLGLLDAGARQRPRAPVPQRGRLPDEQQARVRRGGAPAHGLLGRRSVAHSAGGAHRD